MFENDLRKTVDVKVLTEIVNAGNWKTHKKSQNIYWYYSFIMSYDKTPDIE